MSSAASRNASAVACDPAAWRSAHCMKSE
jgi:hypothetical protein